MKTCPLCNFHVDDINRKCNLCIENLMDSGMSEEEAEDAYFATVDDLDDEEDEVDDDE